MLHIGINYKAVDKMNNVLKAMGYNITFKPCNDGKKLHAIFDTHAKNEVMQKAEALGAMLDNPAFRKDFIDAVKNSNQNLGKDDVNYNGTRLNTLVNKAVAAKKPTPVPNPKPSPAKLQLLKKG